MRLFQGIVRASAVLLIATIATLAPAAVPYILVQGSTYQEGCFAPCLCPMLISAPLVGAFQMDSMGPGDVFDFYSVDDVRWFATNGDVARRITGSGTYKVSEVGDEQEMSLELTIDQNPPAAFDSGTVPLTVPFPDIDTTISEHGGVCRDTVMDVVARPTPRLQVERDFLTWDSGLEIPGYDVVAGKLGALRLSGGDFSVSIARCVANNLHDHTVAYLDVPPRDEGVFILVRAGASTYDEGSPSLVKSRDAGIAASPNACP